jgi:hypothetical protein
MYDGVKGSKIEVAILKILEGSLMEHARGKGAPPSRRGATILGARYLLEGPLLLEIVSIKIMDVFLAD